MSGQSRILNVIILGSLNNTVFAVGLCACVTIQYNQADFPCHLAPYISVKSIYIQQFAMKNTRYATKAGKSAMFNLEWTRRYGELETQQTSDKNATFHTDVFIKGEP